MNFSPIRVFKKSVELFPDIEGWYSRGYSVQALSGSFHQTQLSVFFSLRIKNLQFTLISSHLLKIMDTKNCKHQQIMTSFSDLGKYTLKYTVIVGGENVDNDCQMFVCACILKICSCVILPQKWDIRNWIRSIVFTCYHGDMLWELPWRHISVSQITGTTTVYSTSRSANDKRFMLLACKPSVIDRFPSHRASIEEKRFRHYDGSCMSDER